MFRRARRTLAAASLALAAGSARAATWDLTLQGLLGDYSRTSYRSGGISSTQLDLSGGRGLDLWLERRASPRWGVLAGLQDVRLDAELTTVDIFPDPPSPVPVPHPRSQEDGSVAVRAASIGAVVHFWPRPQGDVYLAPFLAWAKWRSSGVDPGVPEDGIAYGVRAGYDWRLGEHWGLKLGGEILQTDVEPQERALIGDVTLYSFAGGVSWRF